MKNEFKTIKETLSSEEFKAKIAKEFIYEYFENIYVKLVVDFDSVDVVVNYDAINTSIKEFDFDDWDEFEIHFLNWANEL